MTRIWGILLAGALLAGSRASSLGQDTTVQDRLPEINPLSGDIVVLRQQSKKAERMTQVSKIFPQDRVGTAGGTPGRISIDAGCLVTLRGVTAAEGEGLSVDRVGKTLTVRLHHGNILVETFAVEIGLETPHGRVDAKSAYFLAEVGRESTRIIAIDGELKVSNDLGKMDVGAGETVVLRKKAELAKGPPADPERDLAGAAAAEEPFNLFRNPGFELDLKEWSSHRYQNKPLATIDEKVVHRGKKSVRIQLPDISLFPPTIPLDGMGETNSALYTMQEAKVLKQGGRYLLRFWIRTENFTVNGQPAAFKFLSRALAFPDMSPAAKYSVCTCPSADKKWTCVRFVVEARLQGDKDRFGMNLPDAPPNSGVFGSEIGPSTSPSTPGASPGPEPASPIPLLPLPARGRGL
jgi:hypothetical protein